MNTILFSLWFFLPAGIANMMPVFAAKIFPKWNKPLDFGLSYKGKRIFGDHKTVRGIVIGILSGIVIACLQTFGPSEYMKGNPIVFGFLLSFGALFGDAVKSFFKRRVGVASGKTWFPFDQIDYILGGVLFSLLWVRLSWEVYLVLFILYFGLHLVSTTIGYILGLKDSAI